MSSTMPAIPLPIAPTSDPIIPATASGGQARAPMAPTAPEA
jgi:hypothetical protein